MAAAISVHTEYTEVGSSTEPVWTKQYVYLGARLLAVMQPSGGGSERVEFHHPDRLGTRLVTSGQDGSYYEQVTLPFGVALEAESSGATNRRFTSYDRSSVTGLDYAVNRHYDPQQGRFTQVDPVGAGAASLADPQSWNMYSYCGNDPVNRLDPDGLFWGKLFKWVGKGLKWVGVAALVATAVLAVVGLFSVTFATTTLGKVLKFIADIPVLIGSKVAGLGKTIAGVFSFADAGGVSTKLATRIGYSVLLGGSAAAGAVAGHLADQERKKRKIVTVDEQGRKVEIDPDKNPVEGTKKETIQRSKNPITDELGATKRKARISTSPNIELPKNPTLKQRFKYTFGKLLQIFDKITTPLEIIPDPTVLAEEACKEDPNGLACQALSIFLPPEKRGRRQ